MKIGFIGQGWIGKNYADNYQARGYEVVRYSLEKEYMENKNKISECDFVMVAVPTPTDEDGFDVTHVLKALRVCKNGQSVVIKSTLVPNMTTRLAAFYPELFIMHSPEFLSERTAALDVERPHANILGIPQDNPEYLKRAEEIMKTFPKAPFELICPSLEAELIKYSRNTHGYFEVLYYNLLHDYVTSLGANYEVVKKYIENDPLHVGRYASPVHASGHDITNPKRGAGGHCFIKDFASWRDDFEKKVGDQLGVEVLKALENKNIDLLRKSGKDLDLLQQVYGNKLK
jgi:UDP-glucose 6-dehydrogenase